jgi:ATP-dependent DNA helicase RecG
VGYIGNEIAGGFKMASSGFRTTHVYPDRVIKEAITNAVLHRDYRYEQDVQVRIFDDRIEIESPGEFPGNIKPWTVENSGSTPRNPSLVNHLREFPEPPNVDAGEGVPMMFSTMKEQGLFPPQYTLNERTDIPYVQVTLRNEKRPQIWEQVSDWIERNGFIADRHLREIAEVETLEATRMLKAWLEKGLLVKDASGGKKGTVYRKPESKPAKELGLFSNDNENKTS